MPRVSAPTIPEDMTLFYHHRPQSLEPTVKKFRQPLTQKQTTNEPLSKQAIGTSTLVVCLDRRQTNMTPN